MFSNAAGECYTKKIKNTASDWRNISIFANYYKFESNLFEKTRKTGKIKTNSQDKKPEITYLGWTLHFDPVEVAVLSKHFLEYIRETIDKMTGGSPESIFVKNFSFLDGIDIITL